MRTQSIDSTMSRDRRPEGAEARRPHPSISRKVAVAGVALAGLSGLAVGLLARPEPAAPQRAPGAEAAEAAATPLPVEVMKPPPERLPDVGKLQVLPQAPGPRVKPPAAETEAPPAEVRAPEPDETALQSRESVPPLNVPPPDESEAPAEQPPR
jgi:hypothetical protein